MVERIQRLEPLFLHEINAIVSRMISTGSFSGFITITGVKISKDLMTAHVFYSVFGSDEDKKNAAHTLSALRADLGSILRKRIHIKRIPSFTFEIDDTPERAARVEQIFAKIEKANEENK